MPYRWRDSGGFTLVEILMVVAMLSLIGGTVGVAHVYMKNRAMERVVVGDLDAYAQAQMSVWTEEGRFQAHEQLLVSGFGGWSDDVELSEVRVANDRFFVRVRHSRTGYSCALDLSPRTDRAINRKVCRSRASDPALGVPPGIVVVRPGGDTTTIGRPPAPIPVEESVLLPPEVGDIAEVVLDPGESRVVEFPVTNRSSVARTIYFGVSSAKPDAVREPSRPADALLDAGETAEIPVTVSVTAGTLADVYGHVELRAADVADRAYEGAGSVLVRAALVLAAPLVSVPASEVRDAGETFVVTYRVRNLTNAARVLRFEALVPDGALSLSGPVADQVVDAFEEREVPVAFRLDSSAEGGSVWRARLVVTDRDAPGTTTTSDPFEVTTRLVLAAPELEVPATPPPVLWQEGLDRAISYPVRNRSNAVRDLCLVVRPADDAVVAVDDQPLCAAVAPGQQHSFVHVLRGNANRDGVVEVAAYDRLVPEHRADGRFHVRVVDARPVAVWTPPSPVYVRKWAQFDGRHSFSPVGARVVKYIWSWGLFNQRWTGARFEVGGGGVATDELSEPTTRRAWDIRGTFQVCLIVEDESGLRSAPACGAVTTLAETRARLAFRYRGWWHDPADWCFDVPWDNQCPDEHGNARWEILLGESQGDVPIARAWAAVQVEYWQTDDEFARSFTYTGNVETLPYTFTQGGNTVTYDFFSNRHKASGSVQSGRWRILDTHETGALGWPQSPHLARHALVLNANLGSATGIFDGGPHWVPNSVWITLYVQDAFGTITQQSRHLDHDRGQWRGAECINGTSGSNCVRGYERLTPPQEGPTVSLNREDLGRDSYRFTGWGSSSDGRIVDQYWAITTGSMLDPVGGRATAIHRMDAVEVRVGKCEVTEVALVYVDDRGQQGRASQTLSDDDPRCSEGSVIQ
jgi:type II secretory pathway pseudopilin PulG